MSSTAAALRAQAAVLLALADQIEHSTPSSAPSEWVTEAEALRLTGRSKRSFRDWSRSVGLTAHGTTHRRVFRRADLEAALAKTVVRVQAPPAQADRVERRAVAKLASRRVL